jgi:ribosomal protein L3
MSSFYNGGPLKQKQMKGLIGKKAGMTSVFIDGKHMGVTVIDVTGNQVSQLKTEEKRWLYCSTVGL